MNALAAATGPVLMQSVYDHTKDTIGPGTMFVFASFLYFTGTVFVSFLQVDGSSTINEDRTESDANEIDQAQVLQPEQPSSDLEEPLLQSEASLND